MSIISDGKFYSIMREYLSSQSESGKSEHKNINFKPKKILSDEEKDTRLAKYLDMMELGSEITDKQLRKLDLKLNYYYADFNIEYIVKKENFITKLSKKK